MIEGETRPRKKAEDDVTTRFPASPSISFLSSFGRQSSGCSLPPSLAPPFSVLTSFPHFYSILRRPILTWGSPAKVARSPPHSAAFSRSLSATTFPSSSIGLLAHSVGLSASFSVDDLALALSLVRSLHCCACEE